MEMDYELAKKARQVGIPGMTRLHSGYHHIKGTYDGCMEWFREEGVFISVELTDDDRFICKAMLIQGRQFISEATNERYYGAIHDVVEELVSKLPIDKKIRMS